ncbi:RICIN domain-containing protein [Flavobacterium aestuarii]|uniref:RICIN domain-containing protein n=1 Tax=Flavobacterium aestuarii TaxID=3149227 RepID=UPI0032B4CFCA
MREKLSRTRNTGVLLFQLCVSNLFAQKNSYNLIEKARLRFAALLVFISITAAAQAQLSGNPLFTGADPEIHYFNNKYYIYTTATYGTQFHAYSSNDLTNWYDEGLIFDLFPDSPWAQYNGWAPAVVYRNNKYYFYYTAETKIGLAVGNTPIGPFTDIGAPLIGTDPYTDDIIDANVFIDDDGQAYIYYGGSGKSRMVVRKLNPDMVSLATGPADITPPNYTEGPYMVKRKGIYYMMYSNGSWFNDTYNVQYSTSSTPMGPWTYRGKVLSSNSEDKGPGHHGVLKMGNCDEYYIVYHRYENGTSGDRKIAIDRMYFNSADLIEPVNMTNYGVPPRIPDQSCPAQSIVSGGIYKLTHKGTNQCLDVFNNGNQSGTNVQQSTDNGSDAQRWVVTQEPDGSYRLTHKGTNQCLDVSQNSSAQGANVQQWLDSNTDAQRWKIEKMSDGYYKLIHKGTNQCLDVDNNSSQSGANVQQWTDNPNTNNDAQRWKMDLIEVPIVSGGIYRLTHKGTTQSLDVSGGSTQQGANVQQHNTNETDAQRWVITKESDGFYKLTHRNTNQVLDVDNNSSQAGANVQQWTDLGTNAQRWKIELMSDGYFKLTHKNTNLCLDVVNNLAEPGTNVHQYTDNGNDAQRWKLDLIKLAPGTAKVSKSQLKSQNPDEDTAFNIYPNPAENTLFFTSEIKGTRVRVFSQTGTLVLEQKLTDNSINVSRLAAGIYVVDFDKDGKKVTKRFIKK